MMITGGGTMTAHNKNSPDGNYKHIYGNCQDTPLWRAMLVTVEQALEYDKHNSHLFTCAEGSYFGLSDVQKLAEVLSEDYTAQFGPRLSVEGPAGASMEQPHILTFDFDEGRELCRFDLHDEYVWHESGLARAAYAYKRCCG
jgi:hypothetical protein